MFKGDNAGAKQGDTVIGGAVKVEGNFIGEGNVHIEGQLHGTLKTKHNVTIGVDAKVKANVEAVDVLLAGELVGNVKATGKLVLKAGARLSGNVETTMLSVEPGAILNGKCTMSGTAQVQDAE